MSSDVSNNAKSIKHERALKITPLIILGLFLLNILQAIAFVIRSNQDIVMPPVYAADGKTGSVTKLVALRANTQEALAMSNFAVNATTFCLSLDFAGFRDTLDTCRNEYFSTTGYGMFERALENNGTLGAIRTGKGIIKAVLDGMPTLSEPGKIGSELVFTIEIPLVVDRRTVTNPQKPSRQVAIIMLARDNRPNTFDQFRIVQFYIEPRK